MAKICEYKSYIIEYEDELFKVIKDDEEIAESQTEKKAKEIIDKLSKQKLKSALPLKAYESKELIPVSITSVNLPDDSFWKSRDEKTGWGDKGKHSFRSRSDHFYHRTPKNQEIKKKLDQLNKEQELFLTEITKKKRALEDQIESPITRETFTDTKGGDD